ncbi:AAA family ATPase [Ferruginibacter sp. HRS2-29]|uniref:AAA family ATPase n=1 Tax=Ferruginibacter sp. HRS2-29 TaxID=2487334 RepID=UPI0020CC8551|nr:AAA family ATPase [Ferruginibacter sp. HRS2-29]MCP9752997.1 DUF2813 domain-containing protein [Ferruginibacter sp. HRS2-29]
MIRINRKEAPSFFFSERVMKARGEILKHLENQARQQRLFFDVTLLQSIERDLAHTFNYKCAYCESKLEMSGNGDISHFRPKGGARGLKKEEYAPLHYSWLAYSWENLVLSCTTCNEKYKRDYFPLSDEKDRCMIGATGSLLNNEGALLIDPCLDNPEEHLEFDEESGFVRELTKKGKVTIEILGLNRSDLVEKRMQAAKHFLERLQSFRQEAGYRFMVNDPTRLLGYVNELFSDSPPQEYSAVLRVTFNSWHEINGDIWKSVHSADTFDSGNIDFKKSVNPLKHFPEISTITEQLKEIKRFSIRSIEIENFKSIEKLSLEVMEHDSSGEKESWLLLLGDNGIGKSSILQAITLALAGAKKLEEMHLEAEDYLKRGETSGKVIVRSDQDNEIGLYFDANGFTSSIAEPPAFILAYGSTRLLPKGNIKEQEQKGLYLNIDNLFDYSIALTDPGKWMSGVDPVEFNERVIPAFYDVLALKGEDRIYLDQGNIKIKQYGDDHELENSSDGYKAVVAMVADMMKTLSADSASYHNSYGIVLIDEIGTHLHPRWRLKIVNALRKAFPKLQFIVTTHEPLCLRGLAHGEVNVLMRDAQNQVRVLNKSVLPDHSLMRIEELLTSDLFGLINVMDEATEKKYEEYYALLSKTEEDKTEEDKIMIDDFSASLAEKELLGTSPVVQGMFKLFNQEYAQKLRDEGFKTKADLKEETIKTVQNMVQNKKVDWL